MAEVAPPASQLSVDSTSIVLLALLLAASLLHLIRARPQPLLHPILLGRQSEFSRVRREGESCVIRNPGAALGNLPSRPKHNVRTVADLVNECEGTFEALSSESAAEDRPAVRQTSLVKLVARARQVLLKAAASEPVQSSAPTVAILLSEPFLDTIVTLAATTLASPALRIPVSAPSPSSLPSSFQAILKAHVSSLTLVVCDASLSDAVSDVLGSSKATVLTAEDVKGSLHSSTSVDEKIPSAEAGAAEDIPLADRVVLLDASLTPKVGPASVASFTNTNFTASAVGFTFLFSPLAKLESKDRLAIQAPFGGSDGVTFALRAAAVLAATYAGASVATFSDLPTAVRWVPSVLIADGPTTAGLAQRVTSLTASGFFQKRALAASLSMLSDGALCPKFPGVEVFVGKALRAVITTGPITESQVVSLRGHLGATVQRVLVHPFALGPLFASQAFDFQSLSARPGSQEMHSGPPVVNVEAKVVLPGEKGQLDESSVIIKGKLAVSGPTVSREIVTEAGQRAASLGADQWVTLSTDPTSDVELLPNGTVRTAPL